MIISPNLLKRCSTCKENKSVEYFGKSASSKDGLRGICKPCRKIESKTLYAAWTDEQRQNHYLKGKLRKQAVQDEVFAYLTANPCVDCNEKDIVVLEFDHVRGIKEDNVSSLIVSQNREAIWKEIAKCDVVCANCHRRRTAKRAGWYKNDH